MAIYEVIENCENKGTQEIKEPFIPRENVVSYEEVESHNSSNKGATGMVVLSTAVAVCGSFEFGSCVGYSAPTQSAITEDLQLSLSEYSLFGSILTIGAMIGAVTSGHIADFIGRKGAMGLSASICITGWLVIYLAKGALSLDIGRVFTGYGCGVFSYVVPIFIAEIAPKNLRGGLTTVNQLMIVVGSAAVFLIGSVVTWRTLALTGLIPCILLLLGLFFLPESPRWLAKVGHQKEFEVAMQRLRGKGADITQEVAEIQDYIETLQCLPKTTVLDLFRRKYIRSLIIGVGLMVLQQFGGINGIGFYVSETFVSAGFSGKTGTIAYACVKVPVTLVGALLMDISGRRPLIMVSATGTFLGCFITGVSFFLKSHELLLEWAPVLAVAGILIYIGSFAIGMGSVPWVMMSEIFPINVKGAAGSFVTLVNWFGAWAVSYTFNFFMNWSSAGTFFFYSGVSAITVLFVAKFVPETKYSIFGSILTVGAMIGSMMSGHISDLIGRKWAMRISAALSIGGWLAVYLSKGALSLDVGRFLTGYGIGVFSYVVPVFIAEIAPKNLRGGLATLNQLLGIFLIPESPRWLAKAGHQKEFEIALQKLRGNNDISHEAAEIQDHILTLDHLPKAKMLDLFQRRYLYSVTVGVGLFILQQFGGVSGLGYYASETFASAGFTSGKVGTIIYACLQIPVTAISTVLMDKSGRKPLLMVSATGTFLGCFLAGISFYMKGHGILNEWVPTLILAGVLLYIGSFSIGMGAVPWVLMSEIFPINVKGTAGSLVTLVHWTSAWAVSYTFNFLMSWSSSGTFFLYSGFCAITILFVAKLVPETKGRSL